MAQIELCHFIIVKWQAGNLRWSFPLIKSSQQRLTLIFEEYEK